MACYIGDRKLSEGTDSSKQKAEQQAARLAIDVIQSEINLIEDSNQNSIYPYSTSLNSRNEQQKASIRTNSSSRVTNAQRASIPKNLMI